MLTMYPKARIRSPLGGPPQEGLLDRRLAQGWRGTIGPSFPEDVRVGSRVTDFL